MAKIKLGDTAKHAITGFTGVVVARVEYLTGCSQLCLQPQGVTDKGDTFDSRYFDEPYVDLVAAGTVPDRTPGRVEGASSAPGRSGDARAPR